MIQTERITRIIQNEQDLRDYLLVSTELEQIMQKEKGM